MSFSALKQAVEQEKTAFVRRVLGDIASVPGQVLGAARRSIAPGLVDPATGKVITNPIRRGINAIGQMGVEGAALTGRGLTYPLRLGAEGGANVLGRGANALRRGVAYAPGTTIMTLGMAPMLLPDLRGATAKHRQEMTRLMAQQQMGPQKIGLASSILSEDDRNEARRIRQQMEKVAAKQGDMLGRALGVTAAAAGLGAAAQLGGHAMGKIYEGFRAGDRPKRYRDMLRAEPSLKREPLARAYFNVLDRASPYIAGEPYVAAATVRSMIETPSLVEGGVPAVGPRMMKEIMDAEESRQKSRFHPFKTVRPFKSPLPRGFGEGED